MNCESREGRHNLFLGVEAVYSQKSRHLLSMADGLEFPQGWRIKLSKTFFSRLISAANI
jgi:hypothetical protein